MKRKYPRNEAHRLGAFLSKPVLRDTDQIPPIAYLGAAAFVAAMAVMAFVGAAVGF